MRKIIYLLAGFVLFSFSANIYAQSSFLFGDDGDDIFIWRTIRPLPDIHKDQRTIASGTAYGTPIHEFDIETYPNPFPMEATALPKTLKDGVGGYQRGWDHASIQLTITNNLTGVVGAYYATGSESYSTHSTTVISKDNPTEASVQGSGQWTPNGGRSVRPVSGAYIYHPIDLNQVPVSLGTWSFEEGNYYGTDNANGGTFVAVENLFINGTSFIAGNNTKGTYFQFRGVADVTRVPSYYYTSFRADGISASTVLNSISIHNQTYKTPRDLILSSDPDNLPFHDYAMGGHASSGSEASFDSQALNLNSGNALLATAPLVEVSGGSYYGGGLGNNKVTIANYDGQSQVYTTNAVAMVQGGNGIVSGMLTTDTLIRDVYAIAGHAGDIDMNGTNSLSLATGGRGIFLAGSSGTYIIDNSYAQGGHGGLIQASKVGNGAFADGGHGIQILGGTTTISNTVAKGSFAGSALALQDASSYSSAIGGNGVFAEEGSILTIVGGDYTGAIGGGSSGGTADSDGGSGVRINDGELSIEGGTFTGAKAGVATGPDSRNYDGRGIFAVNSDVEVDQTGAAGATIVNNGIQFENNDPATIHSLELLEGTIHGDIDFVADPDAVTTFDISQNVNFNGAIRQTGGTNRVNLLDVAEGAFFRDVTVNDGVMNIDSLLGVDFESANNANLRLNNASVIFENSATFNGNSTVSIGDNHMEVANNLSLNDSDLVLYYNGLAKTGGTVDVGNTLGANPNSMITVMGNAAEYEGTNVFVTAGTSTISTNQVNVDMGWLTYTTNDVSNGLTTRWGYRTLADTTITNVVSDPLLLAELDAGFTNSSASWFYNVNNAGSEKGQDSVEYAITQMPNVVDTALTAQRSITQRYTDRGNDFRTLNNLASASFTPSMEGVAGPVDPNGGIQVWVAGFGTFEKIDAMDRFSEQSNTSFGTVVGIDKSFQHVLLGLAGGFSGSNIDADNAYSATTDNFHGSLYATVGGESLFLDLAATYGVGSARESNLLINEAEFDNSVYSAYAGAGWNINAGAVAITPEMSILFSQYAQDSYDRNAFGTNLTLVLDDYDADSMLGTFGATIAAQHQLDILNAGLAIYPEIRAFYLKEFNADMNPFTYLIGGRPSQDFAVRSRQEDLFNLGFGFDIWGWNYQKTKFEIDYDMLIGDGYSSHTFGGKLTHQF